MCEQVYVKYIWEKFHSTKLAQKFVLCETWGPI